MDKQCAKCNTELVNQSYVDPKTNIPVNQNQCFKCGYSEPVVETVEE